MREIIHIFEGRLYVRKCHISNDYYVEAEYL